MQLRKRTATPSSFSHDGGNHSGSDYLYMNEYGDKDDDNYGYDDFDDDNNSKRKKRKQANTKASGSSKSSSNKTSKDNAMDISDLGQTSTASSSQSQPVIKIKLPPNTQKAQARAQMNNQAKINAKMAKKRLTFLLRQSDVFAHFVQGNLKKGKIAKLLVPQKQRGDDGQDDVLGDGFFDPNGNDDDLDDDDDDDLNLEESVKNESNYVSIATTPPFIHGSMRDYQLEGLTWMVNLQSNGMGGILADEMGLGKTLQSISLLGYMKHCRGVSGPHIVVCPKSTLSNWLNEFNRWCPSLRTIKLHGDVDERGEIISEHLVPGRDENARTFDVLVTSYEIAIIERASLSKIPWVYLVLDEAHRVKNEASKLSEVLRTLSVQHRLLLTGTPLQNNLHELWALLNFLLPEIFSSSDQFDEWFDLGSGDEDAKHNMVTQLHKILKPFMLRRLKKDVATTLPPKKETLLFVGMSEMQREIYRRLLERDLNALISCFQEEAQPESATPEILGSTRSQSATSSSSSQQYLAKKQREGKKETIRLLNIVVQLRKATNHPYLFDGIEDRSLPPLGEHLIQNCGKLALLNKLLPKLKLQESRCLIFCQMTRMLDILEDFCRIRDYSYCRIDGQTSYEDRENSIADFNAPNSEKFIFLLSTRAGGLGINLATADTVILYDSDWNPQVDLQAQDRAHRIGQKKPVHVYRLVTEGTVEEKIIERAETKLRLDAVIIQQGRLLEQQKKAPSKEEMMSMIRFGAEQIFRSSGSTITEEDIDAIISRGEQKTADLNSKLQVYEGINKGGGALDLKLDATMSGLQVFDGVDYKTAQVASSKAEEAIAFLKSISEEARRERRARSANSDKYLLALQNLSGDDDNDGFVQDDPSDAYGGDAASNLANRITFATQRVTQELESSMAREVPVPRRLQINKFLSYQLYPEEEILEVNKKEMRRYTRWMREKWLAEMEMRLLRAESRLAAPPPPSTTESSEETTDQQKQEPQQQDQGQNQQQQQQQQDPNAMETEEVRQSQRLKSRQSTSEASRLVHEAAKKTFYELATKYREELAKDDVEDSKLGYTLPSLDVPGYKDQNISASEDRFDQDEEYESSMQQQQQQEGDQQDQEKQERSGEEEEEVITSNTKFFLWAKKIPNLLSKEENLEKKRLWGMGFPKWLRLEFRAFVRACTRHAPNDYALIHKELMKTKSYDEVKAYADAFVERGKKCLGDEEWEKIYQQMSIGQERAKDRDGRLDTIIRKLDTVNDPMNELIFFRPAYTGDYTLEEDRFLLVTLREAGWGNWRMILDCIRMEERFTSDYFFNALTEDDVSRRCETLSKMMKRDEEQSKKNAEKEKKQDDLKQKKDEEDNKREAEILKLLEQKKEKYAPQLEELKKEETQFLEKIEQVAAGRAKKRSRAQIQMPFGSVVSTSSE